MASLQAPMVGLNPEPQATGSELSPDPLANLQLTHVPLVSTYGSRKGTSWGSWKRRSAGTKLSAGVSRLESSLPVRKRAPGEAGQRKGSNCSWASWTLSLGWKGRSSGGEGGPGVVTAFTWDKSQSS